MYYCPMFMVQGTTQELTLGVGLLFDIRSICSIICSTFKYFRELYSVTIRNDLDIIFASPNSQNILNKVNTK